MNLADARAYTLATCQKFNIGVPDLSGKLLAYLTDGGSAGACLHYACPYCGYSHLIPFMQGYGTGPRWEWNGSLAEPTLTPSIRCNYPPGYDALPQGGCCHHFLRAGIVEVCGDSTKFEASIGKPAPMNLMPIAEIADG